MKIVIPHSLEKFEQGQLHRLFVFCVVWVSKFSQANEGLEIFMAMCENFQDFHENCKTKRHYMKGYLGPSF
jgi:hypothetical protein